MAKECIVPVDVGDAGEPYISIMLRRCFFQDVEGNKNGGVKSFKIHGLMHDVAQKVAGKGKSCLICKPFEQRLVSCCGF